MAKFSKAEKTRIKQTQELADKTVKAVGAILDGHDPDRDGPKNVSGQRLKSFLERVERLEEEKKALAEDIRDVYSEAKSLGFETKIMRKIISIRKMPVEKRREETELLELYMNAIGMQGNLDV